MGIGTKRTQQRCVIDTWIWTDDWLIWSASCFFLKKYQKTNRLPFQFVLSFSSFAAKKIHLYFGDGVMSLISLYFMTHSVALWLELVFEDDLNLDLRTKTIKQFGSKLNPNRLIPADSMPLCPKASSKTIGWWWVDGWWMTTHAILVIYCKDFSDLS